MKVLPFKKKETEPEQYIIGQDIEKDLNHLLKECKIHLPHVDEKQITKAFHWSTNAHKDMVRQSGEPYYTHPLSVALIVAGEIPLDDTSVICALLHEVIHKSKLYSYNDIQSEFGTIVAEIVDGITKIKSVESQQLEQLENYRKLLLAMFKDVRIILIKLADRLHNLRFIEYILPEKQKRIAKETLDIYAPFAQRFGLGKLKWEIEDLAFKTLNRVEYDRICDIVQMTRNEREKYIENFMKAIEVNLQKNVYIKTSKLKFDVTGRAKHIYSIYNKSILREKPVEELWDLFAVRIIIENNDINSCYVVYGDLTDTYKVVPGSYKNYISYPKNNGYQSIHVAIIGPENKIVEVQIRTRQMHNIAEKGVASHFNYKRGLLPAQSVLDNENMEEWTELVKSIFENIGFATTEELLLDIRRNLLSDQIYLFTPANEFKTLPKDSTPLDFAYSIHTDVGNHCIGAKVNGRVIPLDYKLKTGDKVEILTSKAQKPSKEWLKIVVTQKAKSYILKYLKDENIYDENGNTIKVSITPKEKKFKNPHSINLPVEYAACCNPIPGDEIIGVNIPRQKIEIHHKNCPYYNEKLNVLGNSLKELDWGDLPEKELCTKIRIIGEQKPTIIPEISFLILSLNDTLINGLNFNTYENEFEGIISISVLDSEHLANIIDKISTIPGIKAVDRYFYQKD